MKYTVSEPKPWKRILDIEVPSTTVQEELDLAYRKYRKTIHMPGFRQGKVPLDVLKARFGDEIKAEVLEHIIPEVLKKAGEEAAIHPISSPVIEDLHYHEGGDLHFRASLEVKPVIELRDYKGLRLTKRAVTVADEDIQKQLVALQERYASIVRVDGEAGREHYLVADIQTLDASGVPIIGKKQEKQFVRIDSEAFGNDFADQIVGVRAGEERRARARYPEDHPDESVRGQDEYLLLHVRDVLERRLPELNDDFAIDVGAENLEDLKASVRRDLEQQPERELRARLIERLVEEHDFEAPDSMVKNYLDQVVEDARRGSREPVDEEEVRERYHPVGVNQIKRFLILDAIAQKEYIEATQDELNERVRSIAERMQIPLDRLKKIFRDNGRMDRIENDIREEKTVEFLVQHADIEVE